MASPTPSHSTLLHPNGHQRYKTFPGIQSKFPLPYVIPLLLVPPLGPVQAALLPPSYLPPVHICRLFSHGRPLPELGRFTPSNLCSQASRLQPLNHPCCALHTGHYANALPAMTSSVPNLAPQDVKPPKVCRKQAPGKRVWRHPTASRIYVQFSR
ncbi:SHC-transforming protein 4 [Platysternon megacephalum]|uniref:SHC-transforming protein 4 n=1 Tax=Platysternon megacephalum TaxID=55544 RepID=A0A4D9F596_9SAUR|nr:SHC-transforming protein 4 [Platysternon megacephalum]